MRISTLIKKLVDLQARHGDIPIGMLFTNPATGFDTCKEPRIIAQYIDASTDEDYDPNGKPFINLYVQAKEDEYR